MRTAYLSTLLVALLSSAAAFADPVQSNAVTGNVDKIDQQLIGDTDASNNHTNSTSTQLGNSANANGATITTGVDTDVRNQNTVNSAGGAAIGNTSDNKSNANSNSGGNTLGNAQQQGIAGSGNSKNDVAANAAQQQGIAGSGNSKNDNAMSQSNSGGNSKNDNAVSAAQSQGLANAGNSKSANALVGGDQRTSTSVDASNNSQYNSRAVAWAPVLHGAAAPALAAGNVVVVPSACGPRVGIVRRDIVGKRFGVWGGQQDVAQGQDEIVAPAAEPFVQVGPYLMGHIVTTYTTVVGTSSAGSFSLAGYGKNGDGAQGGGAASGQLQQMVQRVTVQECVVAQAAAPAPERAARPDRN